MAVESRRVIEIVAGAVVRNIEAGDGVVAGLARAVISERTLLADMRIAHVVLRQHQALCEEGPVRVAPGRIQLQLQQQCCRRLGAAKGGWLDFATPSEAAA